MKWVDGYGLTPADREHVLRAFVHRYTKEHVPNWALELSPTGDRYPPQFADDADWLAHSLFAVRPDGRLDRRAKNCVSSPTWPDGKGTWGSPPELVRAAAAGRPPSGGTGW